MQIEIFAAIFDKFYIFDKIYDAKVTSDKKMICKSYQRYKGRNRDFCSHFAVIFEIKSKFLIVFAILILGKMGVDGCTGLRR